MARDYKNPWGKKVRHSSVIQKIAVQYGLPIIMFYSYFSMLSGNTVSTALVMQLSPFLVASVIFFFWGRGFCSVFSDEKYLYIKQKGNSQRFEFDQIAGVERIWFFDFFGKMTIHMRGQYNSIGRIEIENPKSNQSHYYKFIPKHIFLSMITGRSIEDGLMVLRDKL